MDILQLVLYTILFASLYFEVFLLITFFEHNGQSEVGVPATRSDDALPTVAIIVPCWNEASTVAGTLRSLLALDYPADKFDIIAVNDGSTDGTLAVLHTFAHYPNVKVIDKEDGGKHSAMNAALAYTRAEIVGCLDADSFVEPDALRRIAARFDNESVAAVTPSIKVHDARGIVQILQKAEYGLAVFVRNTFARMDALFITPGPFSFFRRSVIDEIGPWREAHHTEDLEICLRLQQHHKKIVNEPRAIVHTTAPRTLSQLYQQRVRWTYGFLRNAADYSFLFLNPRYGVLGMFILPMSVVSLLSAVFLFGALVWNTFAFIVQEAVRFSTVGFASSAPHFDVFYLPTNAMVTTTLVLLVLTLALMSIGKRLGRDAPLSLDMPIYIALYGFITPVWLVGALYKALMGGRVRWR